ncbi:dihydrolipoamide dehydrogenase [Rhodobacter veldkampii DSM 11550]|uniref:Dihydrolipoamide dehydrogenase n=1 Tax=Phaeovulum veldkampii DSM 11550 TaxID=1185920 RepID=A0A2T4JJV5_9RHOB|nr:FAD-dependent oxidoreductase [Phaeovulum veldkampii]MBK5946101.1 dihydrolipoamide dehydrogenase [Phaeovulum veldkampii DSM 11550]PTE18200.1 dihydrolipoamide dehydrogenase [Phaeovulum veldkampii DSM 11550]TDQ63499.1 pyruvate/2-oxoglutarate dehydrogenase complex dihydrolipoamide dehydrogenase (E3) component [Phaeovulum veldkampii DSM 11550]
MSEAIATDICVIGAGAGGLSVAAGAAQMGARVVLVEAAAMGGDCLNHGCVPSKALLAAAAAAQAVRAGGPGVAGQTPVVDYAAAMDHVAATIAGIAPHDSQERFEGLGVRVIRDWGRFTSANTLTAGGATISARRFVIATGSRPAIPPVPGLEEVPFLTNESLFGLRAAPDHLLVLGGGPIGCEMAQAHRRLGCRVTLVEAGRCLGRDDPEAAALLVAALRAEGVEVLEGVAVERAGYGEQGLALWLADGRQVTGSHLLVATGRRAALDRLNLPVAGVETGPQGVRVDAGLRTTNRRIFAIGDAAGLGQFTHLAGYHAGLVIRSALLGLPVRARGDHIPRATYTTPTLAQVGLTETEARAAHGAAVTVIHEPFAGNDRARAMARTEGFIKLMVVRGRPVGVTVVGPDADEIIGLWALMLANRLKLSAVAGTVLPYPTLGEISKRASGTYFSPKLFDNPVVKRGVRLIQRVLP